MAGKIIKFFEKNNKLSWFITILIAVFIFYMSTKSFAGLPKIALSWRGYAYHLGIFFLFAFFLLISLTKGKNKNLIFIAVLIAMAYAISDEIHQFFVPGRYCSISDAITDSIGILFASIFYLIAPKKK